MIFPGLILILSEINFLEQPFAIIMMIIIINILSSKDHMEFQKLLFLIMVPIYFLFVKKLIIEFLRTQILNQAIQSYF